MPKSKDLPLKQKVISGLTILMLKDFGLKFISIFGQLLLVKLIAPEYFGIFAILMFVVSVFELITDLGFSQAIIQHPKKLTNRQLSTIFYIKIFLCIIGFFLLLITTPLIRTFYTQITFENIVYLQILGLLLFIKSIKSLYLALFDKDLRFNSISKIEFSGMITYFLVAISVSYYFAPLPGLVFAILGKEFAELAIAYFLHPWKPGFYFSYASVKKMIKYGSVLQVGNLIAFIENAIVPIAGYRLSNYHIGLLDWSLKVTRLSDTVFENYARVSFAGMSKIQNDKERLTRSVRLSINMLNIFSIIFVSLVVGYGKDIINLLLTDKWVPALPAIFWFSASLLFFGTSITIAHALMAQGKSKETALMTGVTIVIEITLALILVQLYGFIGIAIAVFITYFNQFIGYIWLGSKFKLIENIKNLYLSKVVIFLAINLIILSINYLHPSTSVTFLFFKIILSILSYILLIRVIVPDDFKELYGIIKNLR